MGSVTVSIYQDARRKKETGLYPVFVRVYHGKPRLYQVKENGMPLYVSVDDFQGAYSHTKPKPKYQALHDLLHENIAYFKGIIKTLPVFSFDEFEKILNRGASNKESVSHYYKAEIARLTGEDRINYRDNFSLSLKSLLSFAVYTRKMPADTDLETVRIFFTDITPQFLEQYEIWMLKNGRTLSTIGFYLRPLRVIFNNAINDKIISDEIYPFGSGKRKYEIPRGNKVKKALNISALQTLYNHPVEPGSDKERARAFWIFSFLCNGINITDIARCKYKNIVDNNLVFIRTKTRRKTKGDSTPILAPLSDELREVIRKYGNPRTSPETYIFPVITESMDAAAQVRSIKAFTRYINQHLKLLAKDAGLSEDISTYWARHTYATNALRAGAQVELIAESLGHTDIKTTRNYLDSFEDEARRDINNKLTKLLKPVSNGEA